MSDKNTNYPTQSDATWPIAVTIGHAYTCKPWKYNNKILHVMEI